VWFWYMNNHRGWRVRGTALDGPIWVFVAIVMVSCRFSIYPYASLLQLGQVLMFVAIYYLIVNLFDRRYQFRFCVLIVVIGTALSLLGIGQYLFGLDQWWWNNKTYLSSTFVNHSHFAGFLEMTLAVALGILLGLSREDVTSIFQLKVWRGLLAIALGIMMTAFLLTQSRGGWIALAVAGLIFTTVVSRERDTAKWILPVYAVVLVLVVAFLGIGEDRVAQRLHSITTNRKSSFITGRVQAWEASLKIIRDHPVTGTGIGTFVWAFPRYRPDGIVSRYHYAHNDYLQMATETGLLIIPVMLWGIIVLLRKGMGGGPPGEHRLQKLMRLGCGLGALALMLHGLVDFNFHIPANMLVFVGLNGLIARS
ncbi:MAG: O-antigen ligase family protein, partial [Anaerolineae bacterium]|nr:O-antigen ligase family protein [Anaerolineae bacterium]